MYFVFAGNSYYPQGGWSDFIGQAGDKRGAYAFLLGKGYDWWHIVHNGVIIESS